MNMKMRGVSLVEGAIAAVVLTVAVFIAVSIMGSEQTALTREEMVATQAREMNQLSRAVLDYAVKRPTEFTTGQHVFTVEQLSQAGVIPANFGLRPHTGKTVPVSPLGQTYVIRVVSVAAIPPKIQVVISVTGAPVQALMEQAKMSTDVKAMLSYDSEVTQELRNRLSQQSGLVPANSTTLDANLSGYAIDLVSHLDSVRTYSTPVAISGFTIALPLTGDLVVNRPSSNSSCSVSSTGTCPAGTTSAGTIDPCGAFTQAFTQYLDPRDKQTYALSGSYPAATWSGIKLHAIYPDKVSSTAAGTITMTASAPTAVDGRMKCNSHITLVAASSGTGVQEGCGAYQKTRVIINGEGQESSMVVPGYKCYNGIEYTATQYNNLTAAFKAQQTSNVIAANMQMIIDNVDSGFTNDIGEPLFVQRARWIANGTAATPPWNENDPQACGANLIAKTDGTGAAGLYPVPPYNTSGLPLEYIRKGSVSVNGVVAATATCLTEARRIDVANPSNNTWTSILGTATQPALCCGTSTDPSQSTITAPDPTEINFWRFEKCDRPQVQCPPNGGSACYIQRVC